MTESARLAAVIIRIIAASMIAVAALSVIMQLILSVRTETMPLVTTSGWMMLGFLLYLLPGIALYRYSRAVGTFLVRGLE